LPVADMHNTELTHFPRRTAWLHGQVSKFVKTVDLR